MQQNSWNFELQLLIKLSKLFDFKGRKKKSWEKLTEITRERKREAKRRKIKNKEEKIEKVIDWEREKSLWEMDKENQ